MIMEDTEEEHKLLNSSNSSITGHLVPGGVVTTQNISTVIRPKVNINSLQFVKIQTPELSKKAVEQIRIADETKISKEKIKEVEEEWQNNLLNWKSKRRQQLSHSVDHEPDQSADNNNDCGTRKVKTFAEMIEQRAKSGNRLSFHLQRYAATDEEEDEVKVKPDDTGKDNNNDDDDDDDDEGNRSCSSRSSGSSSSISESEGQPPIAAQPSVQARHTSSPSVNQAPSPRSPVKQATVQRAPSPVKDITQSLPKINPPSSVVPQPSPPASERCTSSPVKKTFPLVKPIPPPNRPNPPSVVRICPPTRQAAAPAPVHQQSSRPKQQNSPALPQASPPIMRTSTPVMQSSTVSQESPPSVKQSLSQCKQSPPPVKQILSPVTKTSQAVKSPAPPPPAPTSKQTTLPPAKYQAPPPVNQIPPPPMEQTPPPMMRSCPPEAAQQTLTPIAPTSPLRAPSISPRVVPKTIPSATISPEVTPSHRSQPKPNREDKDKTVLSISGKKRCSSCKEELGRGAAAFVVESLSLVYHTNCFRCSVCHMNLSNGFRGVDVRVHAGQLHCQNCYSKDGLSYSRV